MKAFLGKLSDVDIEDKDGVSVYKRESAEDCWFQLYFCAQTLMQRYEWLVYIIWKFVPTSYTNSVKNLLA